MPRRSNCCRCGSCFGLTAGFVPLATCCGMWPISRKPLASRSKPCSDGVVARGGSPGPSATPVNPLHHEFNRANPLGSSSVVSRRNLQPPQGAVRPAPGGHHPQSASSTTSSSGNAGSGSHTRSSGSDDGAQPTAPSSHQRRNGQGETYVRSNPLNAAVAGALRRASQDVAVGGGEGRSAQASSDAARGTAPESDACGERKPTFQELQRSWFAHPSDSEPSTARASLASAASPRGGYATPPRVGTASGGSSSGRSHFSPMKVGRAASTGAAARAAGPPEGQPRPLEAAILAAAAPADFRALQRSWFAHPDDVDGDGVSARGGAQLRATPPSSGPSSVARSADISSYALTSQAAFATSAVPSPARLALATLDHPGSDAPGDVRTPEPAPPPPPTTPCEGTLAPVAEVTAAERDVEPAASLTFSQRQALLYEHLEQQ